MSYIKNHIRDYIKLNPIRYPRDDNGNYNNIELIERDYCPTKQIESIVTDMVGTNYKIKEVMRTKDDVVNEYIDYISHKMKLYFPKPLCKIIANYILDIHIGINYVGVYRCDGRREYIPPLGLHCRHIDSDIYSYRFEPRDYKTVFFREKYGIHTIYEKCTWCKFFSATEAEHDCDRNKYCKYPTVRIIYKKDNDDVDVIKQQYDGVEKVDIIKQKYVGVIKNINKIMHKYKFKIALDADMYFNGYDKYNIKWSKYYTYITENKICV